MAPDVDSAMKRLRCAFGTLALLLGVATGAPGEMVNPDLLREIYRLSGMEQQIRSVPDHVTRGLDTSEAPLPPEVREALRGAIREAYAPQRLETRILAGMERTLERDVALSVLEWLRSALGREITRLEESASTPEESAGVEAFALGLQTDPPSRTRLGLVRRLEAAVGATELGLDIVLLTALGVTVSVESQLPEEMRSDPDELRRQIDLQRLQLEPSFRQSVLIQMLYVYRELSDGKLEHYVQFAESVSGRRYHAATGEAFRDALVRSAGDLAVALPGIVKSPVEQKEL